MATTAFSGECNGVFCRQFEQTRSPSERELQLEEAEDKDEDDDESSSSSDSPAEECLDEGGLKKRTLLGSCVGVSGERCFNSFVEAVTAELN